MVPLFGYLIAVYAVISAVVPRFNRAVDGDDIIAIRRKLNFVKLDDDGLFNPVVAKFFGLFADRIDVTKSRGDEADKGLQLFRTERFCEVVIEAKLFARIESARLKPNFSRERLGFQLHLLFLHIYILPFYAAVVRFVSYC